MLFRSSYSLLATADIKPGNTDALLAENVNTLPAPSLAYALLLEYYPNPMQQPNVLTGVLTWQEALDGVFADEARAAMVPSSMQALYPQVVEVVRSREFPGMAVSASPRVDAGTREKIRQALLKMHTDESAFQALTELRISQFVPTTKTDYDGSDRILSNFYGYGK